jgi:flagellar biogenesis protein FliO
VKLARTLIRITLTAALLTVWLVADRIAPAADGEMYPAATAGFTTHVPESGDPRYGDAGPATAYRNGPPAAVFAPDSAAVILPVQFTLAEKSEPQSAIDSAESGSTPAGRRPIPLGRPRSSDGSLHKPGAPTPTGSIVTVVSSLAVVLGLFFVFVWITRRNQPRASTALSSEVVQVLGRAPLNGRQQMHLIRIGRKLLLVSVTPTGAETLTEIDDPQEVDHLAALCQQNQPGSITQTFRSILGQIGEERPAGDLVGTPRQDAPGTGKTRAAGATSPKWGDRHEA